MAGYQNSNLQHPDAGAIGLDAVLAALADPHRRKVFVELAARPVEERLCSTFPMPVAKSTKTHHWRVMREAGLVWQRDAGNRLYIKIRREDLDARFPGFVDAIVAAEG